MSRKLLKEIGNYALALAVVAVFFAAFVMTGGY